MTTRKKMQTATFSEKMEIKEILDERLHPVEGTELFRYEEGWNDLRVSQEVRQELTAAITTHIRRECFGDLQRQSAKRTNRAHEVRITALENQLRRLLAHMCQCGMTVTESVEILGNAANNLDQPDG